MDLIMTPKIAKTDTEIESCFDVMLELRPNLERSSFLSTVREMEHQGFLLAYLEVKESIVQGKAALCVERNKE